jgi:lysophospholipase L1-like esterase
MKQFHQSWLLPISKAALTALFMTGFTLMTTGTVAPGRAWASEPPVVVFLGDSLTAGGRWKQWFPSIAVKNQGIPGETTRDILQRIDRVVSVYPQFVLVMAGINDLGAGRQAMDILTDMRALIRELRTRLPETRIVVQSVLPVNEHKFGSRIDNGKIRDLNDKLMEITRSLGADFLDLTNAMSDDTGQLQSVYTSDGVHLTTAGYRSWRLAIADHTGWRVHVSEN